MMKGCKIYRHKPIVSMLNNRALDNLIVNHSEVISYSACLQAPAIIGSYSNVMILVTGPGGKY